MPVSELCARMTTREVFEWQAYARLENDEGFQKQLAKEAAEGAVKRSRRRKR